MKTKRLSKDILILTILTVITVFTWIGVDVYRTLRRPTPPNIPAELLLPLNPKLETRVIDDLTNRQMFERETLKTQKVVPEIPVNEENNIQP